MQAELVLTFFILEAVELLWQQGDTLHKYLNSMLYYYKKSLVLFFALHPSFYFVLFCLAALHVNSSLILFIGILKCLDILLKVSILKRIDEDLPMGGYEAVLAEDRALPFSLKVLPLMIYTTLFYIGISR